MNIYVSLVTDAIVTGLKLLFSTYSHISLLHVIVACISFFVANLGKEPSKCHAGWVDVGSGVHACRGLHECLLVLISKQHVYGPGSMDMNMGHEYDMDMDMGHENFKVI